MLRKYVLPGLFSILVAGATIAVAVNAGDKSDTSQRKVPAAIVVGAIVVLALSALSTTTRPMREQLRQERRIAFRRTLERRLSAVLVALYTNDAGEPKTEWHRVGLHVWLLPSWYRAITPGFKARQRIPRRIRAHLRRERWTPELKRCAKVRLEDKKTPSGVAWRRGKGMIGSCWDVQRELTFNSEDEYKPYRSCTEDEWVAVRNEIRMNLSFQDFRRVLDRYGDVVAVPIFKARDEDDEHPEFVGVLAFDTPLGSHETRTMLDTVVLPTLRAGATRIAEVLK